jgi:hypothetical protein
VTVYNNNDDGNAKWLEYPTLPFELGELGSDNRSLLTVSLFSLIKIYYHDLSYWEIQVWLSIQMCIHDLLYKICLHYTCYMYTKYQKMQ